MKSKYWLILWGINFSWCLWQALSVLNRHRELSWMGVALYAACFVITLQIHYKRKKENK